MTRLCRRSLRKTRKNTPGSGGKSISPRTLSISGEWTARTYRRCYINRPWQPIAPGLHVQATLCRRSSRKFRYFLQEISDMRTRWRLYAGGGFLMKILLFLHKNADFINITLLLVNSFLMWFFDDIVRHFDICSFIHDVKWINTTILYPFILWQYFSMPCYGGRKYYRFCGLAIETYLAWHAGNINLWPINPSKMVAIELLLRFLPPRFDIISLYTKMMTGLSNKAETKWKLPRILFQNSP